MVPANVFVMYPMVGEGSEDALLPRVEVES